MKHFLYLCTVLSFASIMASCGPTEEGEENPTPSIEDEPLIGEGDDGLGELEATSSGKGDASCDGLCAELRAEYGTRPRRYGGLFNSSNAAEWEMVRLLPDVADFYTQRAQDLGYPLEFDEAEIATNFITEGGFFALDENMILGLDGFAHLGVDTLLDNWEALEPWMHQSVKDAVADPEKHQTYTNEKGEQVETLRNLSIEEGLYANAGMLAYSAALAHRYMEREGLKLEDEEDRVQFFWTTIWYNAGAGWGQRFFDDYGITYYTHEWTAEDDASLHNRNARFNALWRTASYEYLRQTTYADGSPMPSAERPTICWEVLSCDLSCADETCAEACKEGAPPISISRFEQADQCLADEGCYELETDAEFQECVVNRCNDPVAWCQVD